MPLNTVIRFAPGLKPVLKHGSHNQKDHAGKGGGSGSDSEFWVTSEGEKFVGAPTWQQSYVPESHADFVAVPSTTGAALAQFVNERHKVSGEPSYDHTDPKNQIQVGGETYGLDFVSSSPGSTSAYFITGSDVVRVSDHWSDSQVPKGIIDAQNAPWTAGGERRQQAAFEFSGSGSKDVKNVGWIRDQWWRLSGTGGRFQATTSDGAFNAGIGLIQGRKFFAAGRASLSDLQVVSDHWDGVQVAKGFISIWKHAQHDQKTHGRDGGSGKKLSTAEEGEAFFNSEEEALGFNRENDNRGALKQSVSNRIAERMSSTVTTKELIDLPLSDYERENFRRAMDPEYEGHVMVNARGELTILASSNKSTFPTGSAEAEKMVRATIISHLVSRWALASNDNDSASLAVQDAAAEVFNIKDAKKLKFPSEFAERHAKESVTHGNVYREFVKAQYAETQEMFQRAGITEVTMYRGRMSNERAPLIPTATPVVMRPLSSWSSDPSTATAFSYAGGAVRQNSIVHKVTVPVKRIVSTPLTGNGCLEEQEFVIMGGRMDTYAMQPENAMRARVLENFPVEVSKAVKVVDLDVDDLSADWIKTLSWDLPVEPKSLEKLFGPNWRAKLEVLPAWLAAPVSLRVQNPVVIKFAPGLVPVLKHGNHNQKDHAGKGGASDTARNGMQLENNTITYGTLEATIPDRESSSFDYQHKLAMAGEQFKYWSGNFATRVASAQMMDIQGGFTARGVVGDEGYVHGALRNPSKTAGLDRRDRIEAETTVIQTAMLMDSSTERLPTGTVLYRGVRLDPKDPRLSVQVGDEFEMPLSAFATGRRIPNDFMQEGSGLREPVMITVKGSPRGHDNGRIGLGGEDGREVVTQGRFRVTEPPVRTPVLALAPDGESSLNITLEQVAFYDIREGEWRDA